MSADPPTTATVTSADLLVSFRVPVGWSLARSEETVLEVQGDEIDGYATTLTLHGGAAEEPGAAWFEELAAGVAARLVRDDPALELVEVDRFDLSSLGARVVMVLLRRRADPDGLPALTILQTWVWAGSDRMLVVGGATPTARESTDLPLLVAAVRSLRLLPHRPRA